MLAKNSNARKETVDIDIFLKLKNDDRKIIQPIGKKSRTPTRMKEEQPYISACLVDHLPKSLLYNKPRLAIF